MRNTGRKSDSKASGWLDNTGYRYGVLFFIGIGLLFRIKHYLGNRSLWIDEAQLALNFVHAPVWSIFHPLANDQMAPVGFLLIETLAVRFFGGNEYILRLYPLVAGIVSVFLVYKLALKLFGARIAFIALAIFSVSHWAIYYAAEDKQYSSDIMVSLILYLATAYSLEEWNIRRWLLLTMAGILGVWLSHPAAFILAAIGLCTGTQFLLKRQWNDAARIALSSILWIGSFAFGLYATSTIGSTAGSATLSKMINIYWKDAFAPFPPISLADIRWYWSSFIHLFDVPLGFDLQGLAAFLFLTGVLYLWRNNRLWSAMLVLPVLIVFVASAFHAYPFSTRLLAFLVPGTIITIAAGLEAIWQITRSEYRAAWYVVIVMLLFSSVMGALSNASHNVPYVKEDIKTVLEHIRKSREPDDKVYVYYGADMAFRYYQARYDIPDDAVIRGNSSRKTWDDYLADVQKVDGFNRVWLVFSHVWNKSGMDDERFLLYFLDKVGKRLDSIKASGASGYLYQFDPTRQSSPK